MCIILGIYCSCRIKYACVIILLCGFSSTPRQRWNDCHAQMMSSNQFSPMKIVVFWFKLHHNLLRMVHLTISKHWFRHVLGAEEGTNHHLNNDDLVYLCIHAYLSLDQFIFKILKTYMISNTNSSGKITQDNQTVLYISPHLYILSHCPCQLYSPGPFSQDPCFFINLLWSTFLFLTPKRLAWGLWCWTFLQGVFRFCFRLTS